MSRFASVDFNEEYNVKFDLHIKFETCRPINIDIDGNDYLMQQIEFPQKMKVLKDSQGNLMYGLPTCYPHWFVIVTTADHVVQSNNPTSYLNATYGSLVETEIEISVLCLPFFEISNNTVIQGGLYEGDQVQINESTLERFSEESKTSMLPFKNNFYKSTKEKSEGVVISEDFVVAVVLLDLAKEGKFPVVGARTVRRNSWLRA